MGYVKLRLTSYLLSLETHIVNWTESLKYGPIEYKEKIVDPTVSPDTTMVFRINVSGATGEITVEEFKLD